MPFFLEKRAFHVKHCRFWRGFLLSFYIGIKRIFCFFFAVFKYKNQDKSLLYCGFDYSYLFDVAARNVNDNVCYDCFIIVLS